jgi:hypothetical protein
MTAHRDRVLLLSQIIPLRDRKLSYAAIGRIVKLSKSRVRALLKYRAFSVDEKAQSA